MNKIPIHKISDKFNGEIAMLQHIMQDQQMPTIEYAHRDDYYMFFVMDSGEVKISIDFVEYEFSENNIFFILPGQVHFPLSTQRTAGWVLAIDNVLVKDEYKKVFEKVTPIVDRIFLTEEEKKELWGYSLAIKQRLSPNRTPVEETILHDLLSYYVGIIAGIYSRKVVLTENNRLIAITTEFKKLLSIHYASLKRPAEYASRLNISAVYLNEVVKKTTGFTVGEVIRNEIILQSKRLLYYTNLSIKEIALELGYEDWAYFTRLFTKVSGISPTQFRKQYLK